MLWMNLLNRTWTNKSLAWATRILSVVFVGMTIFGWWDESQARQDPSYQGSGGFDFLWQWAFFSHLLPALLVLLAAFVGWRFPGYGSIGFGVYAFLQALSVGTELIYLPIVFLPPLLISVLYLFGWQIANSRKSPKTD